MRFILYFTILLCTISFGAYAKPDQSKGLVKKVEEYIAALKSMESNFIQIDTNGLRRYGKVYIKKPDRIRLEYFAPDKELIMLNNDLVMHYNPDLDEINYVPGEDIIFNILSKKNFQISKEANISRLEIQDNIIRMDFILKKDVQKRTLTLRFYKDPMILMSISVQSGEDVVTINLDAPIINHHIDGKIFNFENKRMD
jgi:outer membrane lipoprotein-sorting protein